MNMWYIVAGVYAAVSVCIAAYLIFFDTIGWFIHGIVDRVVCFIGLIAMWPVVLALLWFGDKQEARRRT